MSSKELPAVIDAAESADAPDAPIDALEGDLADAVHQLAGRLVPVQPPAELRERLLQSLAAASRFEDLTPQAAAFYDLPAAGASRLLEKIDSATAWVPGPTPATTCIVVDAGKQLFGKITMILRVPSGTRFPYHAHIGGAEHGLVLQGSCVEDDGMQYRRGQTFVNAGDTAHSFSVPSDGPDFIVALRFDGGVGFPPAPVATPAS